MLLKKWILKIDNKIPNGNNLNHTIKEFIAWVVNKIIMVYIIAPKNGIKAIIFQEKLTLLLESNTFLELLLIVWNTVKKKLTKKPIKTTLNKTASKNLKFGLVIIIEKYVISKNPVTKTEKRPIFKIL